MVAAGALAAVLEAMDRLAHRPAEGAGRARPVERERPAAAAAGAAPAAGERVAAALAPGRAEGADGGEAGRADPCRAPTRSAPPPPARPAWCRVRHSRRAPPCRAAIRPPSEPSPSRYAGRIRGFTAETQSAQSTRRVAGGHLSSAVLSSILCA